VKTKLKGQNPRFLFLDKRTKEQKNKAASKRVCGSLLTHKASESRFNEVKRTKSFPL
jgi:hypothetical protein